MATDGASENQQREKWGAVPQVPLIASRCPRCGSSDRTDYHGTEVIEKCGQFAGEPYDRIVRRRTECRGCGCPRIDIFHELTRNADSG